MTSLLSHKFGPAKYGRGGLAKNMEPRKLAENKNANERNTLPVVYNINSAIPLPSSVAQNKQRSGVT